MKQFNSFDDILNFAIANEQDAFEFYSKYSALVKPEMKEIFIEFAQEEIKHKARLMKIKEEKLFTFSPEKINSLNLSDYTVSGNFTLDLSYQDALILAMLKEKSAFRLYLNLAQKTDVPFLKELFLSLAQEESKHKLRFELEYDEYILKEN
ncbi:MAG: ferritin family protein [Ignavibacteriaceae bacterium]|nr:ferritin family protein [Ignavibacteriaceae bacterium]